VDIWPQKSVVDEQGIPLASEAFSKLLEIFIQYASEENLVLLPGHSYFLAENTIELKNRFTYELIPLLQEYIKEGRLASMESQVQGYIDWLDTMTL
jgi:5-methylcytosine-specific restriction protein B